MPEPFKKLRIKNLDTPSDEGFDVLFNPSEYSIEGASRWSDQSRMGQKPELHYTGGDRKKLSLELFFDTYESKKDVREHTSKIASLLVFNREKHRPPKVELRWGDPDPNVAHAELPFTGVLTTLKQQFVLFLANGTPVRAKLTVVFLEFTLPKEELQRNEGSSPDRTKAYTVKAGDTLSGIAGLFYEDPRQWRAIGRANDVENPRQLVPGEVLTIPRLD